MAAPARAARASTPRRALHVARTREDILMAAARAFMRSGFGAVSMSDIASEVGFSAPALYAYFDSKEEIFAELLRTIWRELLETFQEPPAAGRSFRDNVAKLLRRQLEWTDRRREVFLTFVSVRVRGEPVVCEKGKPGDAFTPESYLMRLGRWLEQAATRRSDFGGHSADDAACALMGIANAFFTRWVKHAGSGQRLADQTDQIVEFFFHGLAGASKTVKRPSSRRIAKSTSGDSNE